MHINGNLVVASAVVLILSPICCYEKVRIKTQSLNKESEQILQGILSSSSTVPPLSYPGLAFYWSTL